MEITLNVPKICYLLSAVLIIMVSILGSPPLLHEAMSQGQVKNNRNSNSTSSSSSIQAESSNKNTAPLNSVSIKLSEGYVNGKIAFFIATDASDNQVAESITKNTGFKVNFAPGLALTPASARQQGYDFVNGIKTNGSPMGFQLGIASALPGEKGYSPLNQLNFVKWNANATARILKSAAEVMTAEKNGELSVAKTNIVINSPAIVSMSNK
ncbi:MAG: hypothetical protein JO297_20905 [Nitrososphaeraceae archaeon]|nr:hypothetical protein [Nitrososphaeraceae archaeon]